jgi:hypothetical protein
MLLFPKICLVYDEKISLLDFKNKDLNKLKHIFGNNNII